MVQSFKEFDRWVVACTCMLLAGKVEDTPKQCKSIIKVAQQFLTQEQMKVFGSNPKVCVVYINNTFVNCLVIQAYLTSVLFPFLFRRNFFVMKECYFKPLDLIYKLTIHIITCSSLPRI